MKVLMMIGAILFALGLGGVIWGLVVMYDDHDEIDLGGDAQIVIDEGDFPPVGIAGAITAGVGLVLIAVGAATGRKP